MRKSRTPPASPGNRKGAAPSALAQRPRPSQAPRAQVLTKGSQRGR
jgi:hypothetical protein